jgi:hypothetical protein
MTVFNSEAMFLVSSLVAAGVLGCTARTEPAREPSPTYAISGSEDLRPAFREDEPRSRSQPTGASSTAADTSQSAITLSGLTANGWSAGSVGASVASAIAVVREQIDWKPPPPTLQPGARVAVIEGDPSVAGKLFTLRLLMPDGYRIAPHWHFADEHVTVISGTFRLGHGDTFDTAAMDTLPAGGFAVLPARHHHFALAQGETEVQLHAIGPWKLIYVNPEDDPSGTQVAPGPA